MAAGAGLVDDVYAGDDASDRDGDDECDAEGGVMDLAAAGGGSRGVRDAVAVHGAPI